MSRFFLDHRWFHKVLPASLFEADFERKITLHAPDLYPDYYVFPFKKTVCSPSGRSAPDLIFIARDYKDWYVVEVEMAHHSYESHVEPQIQNLATANYDNEVIDYLVSASSELDKVKTSKLILNEPVKILMILNAPRDEWAKDLKNKYGVITSVFEVFHYGEPGSNLIIPPAAFEVCGSYPVYSVSTTTQCSLHPYLPYLGIEDNSELKLKPDDKIILEYENCVTFWKAIQGPEASIWIQTIGRNAIIKKDKKYKITKLRDDSLLLDIA